jgi:hypothetical protein
MIRILLAAALLAPLAAHAQQPPADPATQALGQMVVEGAQREASIRAQLIAAQARIATLEAASKVPATTEAPAAK